jgi:hypothetical protein
MSNLLTVQDPDESAVEQATETRRLLQIWADEHLPAVPAVEILPVSDERIKTLRTVGAIGLDQAAEHQAGPRMRGFSPTSEFGRLLGQYLYAVRQGDACTPRENDPREFSYVLEGAAKEFQKRFFQAGMKWNTHAEWMAAASHTYPGYTSGYQDRVMYKMLGTKDTSYAHEYMTPTSLVNQEAGVYRPAARRVRDASVERFRDVAPWLRGIAEAAVGGGDVEYWQNNLCGFDWVGLQVHYMEADGPWVAGYLTLDDACRLRFRRVRLGAYLAEQGESDAQVRALVEQAKQQVAEATFVAYPNDVEWEGAYTSGPGSCMADSASEYNTWDGIHPVSTYSSSLHGCGDNSLVLITSVQGDTITGRGILNLQNNSIVRWYGDNKAERVLKRSGVNTYNREALEGSWLAHLNKGGRFIHPYVDGDLAYGKIEDGRVYIVNDGPHCIQETGGSSYAGTAYYCEDTECEMGEDECTYQEHTDTYISDNCDSWRCPLIDEWVSGYRRTYIMLHGISTEVSEHAWYRIDQFATNMNGGRSKGDSDYSIDDEDLRQRFLDEHGIDDPFEEQDEDDESEEEAA